MFKNVLSGANTNFFPFHPSHLLFFHPSSLSLVLYLVVRVVTDSTGHVRAVQLAACHKLSLNTTHLFSPQRRADEQK